MKTGITFKEELIGKEIKVVTSKNKSDIGISGVVIDDTSSTVVIKTSNSFKRILKAPSVFQVGNQMIIVNGTQMMGTSSERN